MEKYMKTCMFILCFHESTKHACFHVNFPFIAYFYPHYVIMVKGLFFTSQLDGKN